MADIQGLINNIINDTHSSYKQVVDDKSPYKIQQRNLSGPVFDKGEFRNKLSMFVLKDIVGAMMHDDTKDVEGMIDDTIEKHLSAEFNKSNAYDYLIKAKDNLNSPLVGDIIQEIDDAVDKMADDAATNKEIKITDYKEILKNVDNYDTFRELIKDLVSKQVVDDVAKTIINSNDAPVFDNIDEKITTQTNDGGPVTESVIIKMTGNIVSEAAMMHEPITTEVGLSKAVLEYCIYQMDSLFKNYPRQSICDKYRI